jgi:hypothetical protein
MSYTFRIRFDLSSRVKLQIDELELLLPFPNDKILLTISANEREKQISESKQLVLIGAGFFSQEEAYEAGRLCQNALMVTLARLGVGADFGDRFVSGVITNYGLQWLEQKLGQRILPNKHGLMVYESDPPPLFATINANFIIGKPAEKFKAILESSIQLKPLLVEREELSYRLFNASFFQPADSRFLLLFMAVEALAEAAPRSKEAQEYVGSLIEQTNKAKFQKIEEKNSIIGALRRLKEESINQAGKRLAKARLNGRLYNEQSAQEFFEFCYKLRNDLVHCNFPVPTYEEISSAAGKLETFVADLLTIPILGIPSK